MSIGARIREVRKETGRSQTVFAKRFDVSLSALKAYELDDREPPASFLVRLYTEMAIDPTWLLTGAGSKTSDIRSQNIVDAVIAVRTFSAIKRIQIEPEREARLVLLLSEYFDEGGSNDTPLVQKMLETAT